MFNIQQTIERFGYVVLPNVFTQTRAENIVKQLHCAFEFDKVSTMRSGTGVVYGARNVLALWPDLTEVCHSSPLFESCTAILGDGFGRRHTERRYRIDIPIPMLERQKVSTNTPWEKTVGYSRAVRVGQFVYVCGTTASDENGKTVAPEDGYAQTRYILKKIEAALVQVGAKMYDVVRTRLYVTDISKWEEIGKAHGEVFAEIRPAATMVEVSRLVNADHMVEIEVDAIVDDP